MSESRSVVTSRADDVLIIKINRPDPRNAVDLSVALGLEKAVEELDSDDRLQVGILVGEGKGFCSGMDLKAFARGERPVTERAGFAGIVKRPPRKVLIAAIEGYALAGGLDIALSCDLIGAARDAKLGLPEVRVGLMTDSGSLFRLPDRLPYNLAMEIALTGDPIEAEAAHSWGLVNRLCEPGEALATALELGHRIASNAPLALVGTKESISASRDWTAADAWSLQANLAEPVNSSQDALEGPAAFLEKRAPRWQGH